MSPAEVKFTSEAFNARNTYILTLYRMAIESGLDTIEATKAIERYTGLAEDIIWMALDCDFTFDF